mgnify:CR=1 FL=1
MLRRFSSATSLSSFSSFLKVTASTSSDQESDSKSTHSNLADALESSLLPQAGEPRAPQPDRGGELVEALETLQTVHRAAYSQRLALIASVLFLLTEDPDTRNAFREHGGFLSAVSALASLDESVAAGGGDDADSVETRAELRYQLASVVFNVLAVASQAHDLNRSTFAESVGFDAVGEAIKLSGLMRDQPGADARVPEQPTPAERLLSILYSFLTADFSSPPLFTQLRRHLAEPPAEPEPAADDGAPAAAPPTREERITAYLRDRSAALDGPDREVAENAEIVPLILELEASLGDDQPELRFAVVAALLQLATSSRRSQVALNTAGVVGIALERLHPATTPDAPSDGPAARAVLRQLTENLLEMGAGTKETRKLFQSVVEGWESHADSQERLNEEMLALM